MSAEWTGAGPVKVDGSVLEGGGQILRVALSCAALYGTPLCVTNIRAGRSKPGLAAQHLKGIQLVAAMCNAKVVGAHIGSTQIEFTPGLLRGGSYVADTQTAGSISLLLQVALPCALFCGSPVKLELKGGTNADMAPQIDYMTEVFRPMMEKLGGSFDLDLHRRGYYPKGGGHVTVTVNPVKRLRAATLLDQGIASSICGWSFVAGTLPLKLAYQMSDGAKQVLSSTFKNINVKVECYKEAAEMAPHNCNGIVLVCETSTGCVLGGSALGGRAVQPSAVGRKAAEELCAAFGCGACVDTYTQDQLIIFMALAQGTSKIKVGEVTLHTQTAIYIAELLTKCKFTVTPSGGNNIIECSGVGLTNRSLGGTA